MPVLKQCVVCGKEFSVPPCREKTASTCSNECAISVRAESRRRHVTFKCKKCGKVVDTCASVVGRRVYCSAECKFSDAAYLQRCRDRVAVDKNPMWHGGKARHTGGYVYKHAPMHPYSSNGYVLEHRLVMEEWLIDENPKSVFLIRLGKRVYLSPKAVVHHIDWNRKNNSRENLIVCSKGFHSSLHNGNFVVDGEYWPQDKLLKTGREKSKMNETFLITEAKDIPYE